MKQPSNLVSPVVTTMPEPVGANARNKNAIKADIRNRNIRTAESFVLVSWYGGNWGFSWWPHCIGSWWMTGWSQAVESIHWVICFGDGKFSVACVEKLMLLSSFGSSFHQATYNKQPMYCKTIYEELQVASSHAGLP